MLKPLHKSNTQISPFVVTKDWSLSNTFNDWVVLTEHSGGLPIALEYQEYNEITTSLNSSCNVAMEQQYGDRVLFREGEKATGLFYPESENVNIDGTYKRMVYSQVHNMFYNSFRDPTKIWGLEYLDFENSQTQRFLTDKFKMYDIPMEVFGEKVVENSVVVYNQNLDNDYTIVDDGKGNLYAVSNLFSRQQELGDFTNNFVSGTIDSFCNRYFGLPGSIEIEMGVSEPTSSFSIGLTVGSVDEISPYFDTVADFDVGLLGGGITSSILLTSASATGSVESFFYSGSLVDVVLIRSASATGSVESFFYSGSLFDAVLVRSSSVTSSVVESFFYTGSIFTQVPTSSITTEPASIIVGLISGSLG